MVEKCYKDFISLMDVDAEPENIEHKLVVLNKLSKLCDDLIKEYKKIMKESLNMIKTIAGSKNMTPKL